MLSKVMALTARHVKKALRHAKNALVIATVVNEALVASVQNKAIVRTVLRVMLSQHKKDQPTNLAALTLQPSLNRRQTPRQRHR
jgi:hypothetical protein